jgi:hypothetical protein
VRVPGVYRRVAQRGDRPPNTPQGGARAPHPLHGRCTRYQKNEADGGPALSLATRQGSANEQRTLFQPHPLKRPLSCIPTPYRTRRRGTSRCATIRNALRARARGACLFLTDRGDARPCTGFCGHRTIRVAFAFLEAAMGLPAGADRIACRSQPQNSPINALVAYPICKAPLRDRRPASNLRGGRWTRFVLWPRLPRPQPFLRACEPCDGVSCGGEFNDRSANEHAASFARVRLTISDRCPSGYRMR